MSNDLRQPNTLLLCIPIGLFSVFFVTYAVCYDYDYGTRAATYEYDLVAHKEAIQYTTVFAIALIIISSCLYAIFGGQRPTTDFFIYAAFNGVLYLAYSTYLYKNFRLAGYPRIRHWLFWPVVVSIGMSLYYGRYFATISSTLGPHFPILLLLAFFLIAEIVRFRKKLFLIVSLVGLVGLFALTLLYGLGLVPMRPILGVYLPSMLFCIIMAAYLSVFEAWRVTAFIASQESAPDEARLMDLPESISESSPSELALTKRYYSATLLAQTIAVWLIPFAYVFSNYSFLFIALFTIHSIAAFGVWLIRANDERSLVTKKWEWVKNSFGMAFLIIMVLGAKSKFDVLLNKDVLFPIFDWVWYVLVGSAVLWGRAIYKEYQAVEARELTTLIQSSFLNKVIYLFSRKINVARLVGVSTSGGCWVILLLNRVPAMAQYANKLQHAFLCYLVIFVTCCIVEFFNITNLHRFSTRFMTILYGTLYTMRTPPSLLIGLAVLLPSLSSGVGFRTALLSAIPFTLSAMGGFALNDFFDVEKDSVNKPCRPLPSKKLGPSYILGLAAFLLTAAFLLSFQFSINRLALLMYLSCVLGVMGYNLVVRYLGIAKAFYTAAFSSLPFVYVVSVNHFPRLYFLAAVATLFIVSARELLMDVRDIRGDTKSGITTLPMIYGALATGRLAFLLLLAGLLILLPFVFSTTSAARGLLWLMMIFSVVVMYKVWWLESGKYQRDVIRTLWLTMLLGVTLIAT
jgi:geranylgeranylglycerol-phosphate geranylgeranyltransferase